MSVMANDKRCPVLSIFDQECRLSEGHPEDSPTRFHRYPKTGECLVPPPGWACTRGVHADGPCAAVPIAPNLRERERVISAMPWYDESEPDYTELDAVLADIRTEAVRRSGKP